jgi:LysM repeat protein
MDRAARPRRSVRGEEVTSDGDGEGDLHQTNSAAKATITAAVIAALAATVVMAIDGRFRHSDTMAIIDDGRAVAATQMAAEVRIAWPGQLVYEPLVTYHGSEPLEVTLAITNTGLGSAPEMAVHVWTGQPIVKGPEASWPYDGVTPTVVPSPGEFFIHGGDDFTPGITSQVVFYVDCPGLCSAMEAESVIQGHRYEVGCATCPMEKTQRLPTRYEGFPPTPTPSATVTPTPSVIVYVVQSGDTLSSISRDFGVSVQAILDANPSIDDPSLIGVGDALNIPRENPHQDEPTELRH